MADNKDNIAINRRRGARGAVLGLLEEGYPDGVAFQVIERILHTGGKCQAHELPGILRYLEDKGYIKITVPEEPSIKPLEKSIVELSAHGIDLLEGSIPEDPGVDI
jgi:DNA-binding PadR family transcriptional regulator